MPSDTTLSTPALLSAERVRDGTIALSGNDSTLMGATDHDKTSGDSLHDNASSPSTNPKILVSNVLEPDIDAASEFNKTDSEIGGDSEVEQNDDEDNDKFNQPSRLKQDRHHTASAQTSQKRKADTSHGKKATGSGLITPAKKKQKVNQPTTQRQRKVGISKPKTAKQRFLAASAEDTRPLSWGEPEVWAEVCFPCRWISAVKAKISLDPP